MLYDKMGSWHKALLLHAMLVLEKALVRVLRAKVTALFFFFFNETHKTGKNDR